MMGWELFTGFVTIGDGVGATVRLSLYGCLGVVKCGQVLPPYSYGTSAQNR